MDAILARFRNLVQNIDTIEEHNRIAAEKGRVLWGWWKKDMEPMPDPYLYELSVDLIKESKHGKIYFIDSGYSNLYEAKLFRIHYRQGGLNLSYLEYTNQKNDDDADTVVPCPEYYQEKKVAAYFEIGPIRRCYNVQNELSCYVFSKNNRVLDDTIHSSSLSNDQIGQVVADIDFLEWNLSLWFMTELDEYDIRNQGHAINISNGKWPIKGKYIIHLSDLHFGKKHAYKNMLGSNRLIYATQTLFDSIKEDIEDQGIGKDEIALFLITGDLTWSADPHEFANAKELFDKLSNYYGVSNKQIIIVPGNHDIEWQDGKGEIDNNAELNYKNFYTSFYDVNPDKTFMRISKFQIGPLVIGIIALNSCRLESKENAGFGYIGQEQISKAQKYLSTNNDIDMAIAFAHHHILPVNYREEVSTDIKKVSMLLDAEMVMQNLISNKIKVYLHGHQHQPYYSQITRIIPDFILKGKKERLKGKLTVIGGGSCGVEQGSINLIGRNTYNIISFPSNGVIKVETRIKSGSGMGYYTYAEEEIEI